MIQAMQVLQLTTPELLDRLEAELEDNPFLELAEGEEDEEVEGAGGEADAAERSDPDEEPELTDPAVLENLLEAAPPSSTAPAREAGDPDALSLAPAPDPFGRTEELLAELRVRDLPPEVVRDAEMILAFLDPRGFLPGGLEEVAELTGTPLPELQTALEELRRVAHPAIGAHDLREAFLLQLDAMEEEHPLARAIVEKHFEQLLGNRLPQIAREEGVGIEDVRHALEVLALLDHRPWEDPHDDRPQVLLPDVVMEEDEDGRFQVRLVREGLPEVRLTRKAQEILEHAKDDPRLHQFLMRKIERARWFLDAVQKRRETLFEVASAIARRQGDFLRWGPEHLKPMKMQEVADEVGVHLSTVSRAIRGKNALTPQGIIPLRRFFSGGQSTARGGSRSRLAIQERVKEIVASEDPRNPFSDEEIVRILRERDGVRVARRTVTKYRQALGIPSSSLRKSF